MKNMFLKNMRKGKIKTIEYEKKRAVDCGRL